MKASYFTRKFEFNFPAGTSRGVLHEKYSSYILIEETLKDFESNRILNSGVSGGIFHSDSIKTVTSGHVFRGVGECSTIPGLSPDPMDRYEAKLQELCNATNKGVDPRTIDLSEFPSIQFGLEMALQELKTAQKSVTETAVIPTLNATHRDAPESTNIYRQFSSPEEFIESPHLLFTSDFTQGKKGIPINGLIWMGDKQFMKKQIAQKLEDGFRCLKLKVGALDFETEVSVIKDIRKQFSPDELELRLDANGAFTKENAEERLNTLAHFQIHSIEQPIRQGQHEAMAELCRTSPIPVALDEELISFPVEKAEELLLRLRPAYIILKPSLLGGFAASQQWINAAERTGTNWWVTSALESNIGLNAIAQWTYTLNNPIPQGLGTGQIYKNNFLSPLYNKNSSLMFNEGTKKG
jgi:o-succinylbenzoate synthase